MTSKDAGSRQLKRKHDEADESPTQSDIRSRHVKRMKALAIYEDAESATQSVVGMNYSDDDLSTDVDMTDYSAEAPRERDLVQPPRPKAPVPWLHEQDESFPLLNEGWDRESAESFRKFYPFEPIKNEYQHKRSELRRNYLPYFRHLNLPKPLAVHGLNLRKCCQEMRYLFTEYLPSDLTGLNHQNICSAPFDGLASSSNQTSAAASTEPMDVSVPFIAAPTVTENEVMNLTAEIRICSLTHCQDGGNCEDKTRLSPSLF